MKFYKGLFKTMYKDNMICFVETNKTHRKIKKELLLERKIQEVQDKFLQSFANFRLEFFKKILCVDKKSQIETKSKTNLH